jgi:hypothetical protein
MKVTINTASDTSGSPYLNAGAPTCCFLPSCHKTFSGSCVRGLDSHFYCSQECTDQARSLDMDHVQQIPLKRA